MSEGEFQWKAEAYTVIFFFVQIFVYKSGTLKGSDQVLILPPLERQNC